MKIEIDQSQCISCGACVVLCPVGAIRLLGGKGVIDQNVCIKCKKCICKCYARAIKIK